MAGEEKERVAEMARAKEVFEEQLLSWVGAERVEGHVWSCRCLSQWFGETCERLLGEEVEELWPFVPLRRQH